VIYDDDFEKNYFYQIMPNGRLKCSIGTIIIKLILEISQIWSKSLKIIRPKKAVLDSSLYKYKKIDLRFTKQVVCTK
jgi:cell division protein FtsQ